MPSSAERRSLRPQPSTSSGTSETGPGNPSPIALRIRYFRRPDDDRGQCHQTITYKVTKQVTIEQISVFLDSLPPHILSREHQHGMAFGLEDLVLILLTFPGGDFYDAW